MRFKFRIAVADGTGKGKIYEEYRRKLLSGGGSISEITPNITMEEVLHHCFKILAEEEDTSAVMSHVLKSIGAYYQADRTYIFEIDTEKKIVGSTFEWCRPGISEELVSTQRISFKIVSKWLRKLKNGEVIIINSVREELEYESEIYQILTEQNVHSLILSPLRKSSKLVGFLGVDNPQAKAGKVELLHNVINLRFWMRSL